VPKTKAINYTEICYIKFGLSSFKTLACEANNTLSASTAFQMSQKDCQND